MKKRDYSIILGNLGNTCDRFLSSGYKEPIDKRKMIEQAASIEGVTGIELVGTWDIDDQSVGRMQAALREHNLACASIIPDLFAQKRWGRGALASADDMIVGAIRLPEYFEMLYWMERTGYAGWFSMDQYPYREDGYGAIRASVLFVQKMHALLDQIGLDAVGELLRRRDPVATADFVRNHLLART